MSTTAPHAPAGLSRLKTAALAVGGWTLAAAGMTLAQSADAIRRGGAGATFADFGQNLLYFIPLMALSFVLHRHFMRLPNHALEPRRLALTYAAVALAFFPTYLAYQSALTLMQTGKPLAQFWDIVQLQRRMNWWVDFMIVTGAFAMHAAIATWLEVRERERILLLEKEENLKLRLSLLQGQLEPHFLFNALSGVSALVRTGERATALTALSRISDLLRYALRASRNDNASVADEMQFIEGYLKVQQLRFGERLALDIRQADAPWALLPCPPLLLHPLVENAIRHGLEPRDTGCHLEISLGHEQGIVTFETVNEMGPSPAGNGVGHTATCQRLKALFGDTGTLTTFTQDGRYHAVLKFPADPGD